MFVWSCSPDSSGCHTAHLHLLLRSLSLSGVSLTLGSKQNQCLTRRAASPTTTLPRTLRPATLTRPLPPPTTERPRRSEPFSLDRLWRRRRCAASAPTRPSWAPLAHTDEWKVESRSRGRRRRVSSHNTKMSCHVTNAHCAATKRFGGRRYNSDNVRRVSLLTLLRSESALKLKNEHPKFL